MALILVPACLLLSAISVAALWSCRRSRRAMDAMQREARDFEAASRHCPVTGLANRACAEDWLAREFADPDSRPAVICAGFTPFAPGLEREAALVDRLVDAFAQVAPDGALLARTGPGSYLVAVGGAMVAGDLVSLSRSIATTFSSLVSETERLRVGVALALGSDTPELLIDRAARARDEAGGSDPVTLTFTDPDLAGEIELRTVAARELAEAIRAGRIEPFFQPIVELGSGRILGFEVLARWRNEAGNVRMPGEFLPLAEESGLVGRMYYSLLASAAQEVCHWPADWNFALNLSASQIGDVELVDKTMRILLEAGIEPGRLELEISERALSGEPTAARELVDQFRSRGVAVTLDNFGSGNLHLRDLARFTFDRIKVDPVAIGGADGDPGTAVGLVAAAARYLGVPVLAQGLETHAGAAAAQLQGCDIGQGYLFGRPDRKTECFRLDGTLGRHGNRAA